jgi:hypothetical protein
MIRFTQRFILFILVYIVAFIVIYNLKINRSTEDTVLNSDGEITLTKLEVFEKCKTEHYTVYPKQVDIKKWRACNGYD